MRVFLLSFGSTTGPWNSFFFNLLDVKDLWNKKARDISYALLTHTRALLVYDYISKPDKNSFLFFIRESRLGDVKIK